MLDYFSTFRIAYRQQRALFRALAQWQRQPLRDLGDFGLSVTSEITNPSSAAVTIQFLLHHEGGGMHASGLFSLPWDGVDLEFLPADAQLLLHEFLLPSAISSGEPWHSPKPLKVLEGGLQA